jgi:chromosome segregation and condensation protein ScpB
MLQTQETLTEEEFINREYELFRQMMTNESIPSILFFSREDIRMLDMKEICEMDEEDVSSLLDMLISNSSVSLSEEQLLKVNEIFRVFFVKLCLFYKTV